MSARRLLPAVSALHVVSSNGGLNSPQFLHSSGNNSYAVLTLDIETDNLYLSLIYLHLPFRILLSPTFRKRRRQFSVSDRQCGKEPVRCRLTNGISFLVS